MEKKERNKGMIILSVLLLAVYFCLLCGCFEHSIFTSDSAGLLLEARDMLRGNFFLNGWTMTGVSFITTDLFSHGLGVIFAGATEEGAALGGCFAAFFLTLTCLMFALSFKGKKVTLLLSFLFFMGFFAFPCEFLMDTVRYHSTGIAEALLGYFLLRKAMGAAGRKRIVLTFVSVFLLSTAAMSDADTILALTGPVTAYALWNLIHIIFRKDAKDSRGGIYENGFTLAVSSLSLVLGVILDKLYFAIGTADKNTFMEGKSFAGVSEYHEKFLLLIEVFLKLFNADVQGKTLLCAGSFYYCVRIGIILLGLVFVVFNLVRWLGPGKCDPVSVIFSLGILFPVILFIISGVSVDEWSARYIAYFPAFFGVLIIRGVPQAGMEIRDGLASRIAVGIALVLCFMFMADSIKCGTKEELDHWRKELGWAKELARVLEDNGLKYGYGPFWFASSTTLVSKEKVFVRAICESGNRLDRYTWFSKDEWYETYADFVVTERSGVTMDRVMAVMGEPERVLTVNDELSVLVYDRDISPYFDYSFNDGKMEIWEWYRSDGCYLDGDKLTVGPGGNLWGPYFELGMGEHSVRIQADEPMLLEADVYSKKLGRVLCERQFLDSEGGLHFELPESIDDFELRVYNDSTEAVTITGAYVE